MTRNRLVERQPGKDVRRRQGDGEATQVEQTLPASDEDAPERTIRWSSKRSARRRSPARTVRRLSGVQTADGLLFGTRGRDLDDLVVGFLLLVAAGLLLVRFLLRFVERIALVACGRSRRARGRCHVGSRAG